MTSDQRTGPKTKAALSVELSNVHLALRRFIDDVQPARAIVAECAVDEGRDGLEAMNALAKLDNALDRLRTFLGPKPPTIEEVTAKPATKCTCEPDLNSFDCDACFPNRERRPS